MKMTAKREEYLLLLRERGRSIGKRLSSTEGIDPRVLEYLLAPDLEDLTSQEDMDAKLAASLIEGVLLGADPEEEG